MNTEEQNYSLEEIIEQSFDFSEYPADEKELIIEETAGMIMESTMLRLLNEANSELQEKFGELVKTEPSDEVITAFIAENFPSFNKVLIDEVKIFKTMGEKESDED
jgi:hypothetical protein